MQFKFAVLLYSAAALTPLAVLAQQTAAKTHPADPNAMVPAVTYESAFADYMPYRDEKLTPWRDVNDEAGRIGGQAGIFGGAGHGGHGSAKPTAKPQSPAAMPGGMQGMDHK